MADAPAEPSALLIAAELSSTNVASTAAAPLPAPSPSSGGEGGERPTEALGAVEQTDVTAIPVASHNGNGHAKGNGSGAFVASLGAGQKMAFSVSADSPSCMECGSIMVRNGSCYKCLNCGSTSGCS